jgi:hypothetical protein
MPDGIHSRLEYVMEGDYYKYRLSWTSCNGKGHTKLFDSQADSFKFIRQQKNMSSKDFGLCTIRRDV